jgi:hypothetical protein
MTGQTADIGAETIDEQLLVRLIMYGIYPLYNHQTKKFNYLKNEHGFYFGTCKTENFNKHWHTAITYLPDGMLNEQQLRALDKIGNFTAIELIPKQN